MSLDPGLSQARNADSWCSCGQYGPDSPRKAASMSPSTAQTPRKWSSCGGCPSEMRDDWISPAWGAGPHCQVTRETGNSRQFQLLWFLP